MRRWKVLELLKLCSRTCEPGADQLGKLRLGSRFLRAPPCTPWFMLSATLNQVSLAVIPEQCRSPLRSWLALTMRRQEFRTTKTRSAAKFCFLLYLRVPSCPLWDVLAKGGTALLTKIGKDVYYRLQYCNLRVSSPNRLGVCSMRHTLIVLIAVCCFAAFSFSQTADELIAKNIQPAAGWRK